MPRRNDSETTYINVDLDVAGREDLSPLVDELARKLTVLHAGKHAGVHSAHFEVPGLTKTADAKIREFLRVLRTLTPAAERLWRDASHRDFNIGIQAGTHPNALEFFIDAETVKAAAAVGARIGVTVYAYGLPVVPVHALGPASRRAKRKTT